MEINKNILIFSIILVLLVFGINATTTITNTTITSENITITGTLDASVYSGDGSGLSGVSAPIGSLIMHLPSLTGAENLSTMIGYGWAVANGTNSSLQGVTSVIIEEVPDMRNKFIRSSNDTTSGTTGGSDTKDLSHTHTVPFNRELEFIGDENAWGTSSGTSVTSGSSGSATQDIIPAYYEAIYMIKVR